jgi:hypothetical protein
MPTVLPPKRPRGRPKKNSNSVTNNAENDRPMPLVNNENNLEVGLAVNEANAAPEQPPPEPIIWDTVEEGTDPGYEHTFIYAEEPGPKHCPDSNASPIDYFNMFFTLNILGWTRGTFRLIWQEVMVRMAYQ